jgi:hypothetical protein
MVGPLTTHVVDNAEVQLVTSPLWIKFRTGSPGDPRDSGQKPDQKIASKTGGGEVFDQVWPCRYPLPKLALQKEVSFHILLVCQFFSSGQVEQSTTFTNFPAEGVQEPGQKACQSIELQSTLFSTWEGFTWVPRFL